MEFSQSAMRWSLLTAAITAYSEIFHGLIEEVGKFAGDTPFGTIVASMTFLALFGATYLATVGLEHVLGEELSQRPFDSRLAHIMC
jgi:hypothetical protein